MTTLAPSIQSTKPRRPKASTYRPHIRRLGKGVYQIGSRTIPGALYTVTLTGRETHVCSCPAYAFGRDCWHHAAARQASAFFAKWYGQATRVMTLATQTPAAAPAPIPFNQTTAFQRLAECFA